MKARELRKLDVEKLLEQLRSLRAELLRLRALQARGSLGKESGKVRSVRKDIARVLTLLREKGVKL
ncbi:MAG: 50S ribosomal protein L29 [Nitrososphaerota archaeon]